MTRVARSVSLAVSSLLAAFSSVACGPSPERAPFEPDCSVEEAYDFKPVPAWYDFPGLPPGTRSCNDGLVQPFYCAPDSTPPIAPTAAMGPGFGADHGIEAIEPDRCGSTRAHTLRFEGNRDWGAVIGTYDCPTLDAVNAVDDSERPYDGISFWARQTGDPGFMLILNDKNTRAVACLTGVVAAEDICTPITSSEQINAGGFPAKGTCDNNFELFVVPTSFWQFYTIPFTHFTQQFWPNRIPSGIDPATIHGVVFRGPKDTRSELWIDRIAWYRN